MIGHGSFKSIFTLVFCLWKTKKSWTCNNVYWDTSIKMYFCKKMASESAWLLKFRILEKSTYIFMTVNTFTSSTMCYWLFTFLQDKVTWHWKMKGKLRRI